MRLRTPLQRSDISNRAMISTLRRLHGSTQRRGTGLLAAVGAPRRLGFIAALFIAGMAMQIGLDSVSPVPALSPQAPPDGALSSTASRPADIPPGAWQRVIGAIQADRLYADCPYIVADGVAAVTVPSGATRNWFGYSVDVSGDTMVVGAFGEDELNLGSGATYVFERNQGGLNHWGQVKRLLPTTSLTYGAFGQAVAIDGDTILVGCPSCQSPPSGSGGGAAFVFERNQGGPGNWGQVRMLYSGSTGASNYGSAVAIDGDTLIIGDNDSPNRGGPGIAYIHERHAGGSGNWGKVATLVASDGQNLDEFGYAVAVDGTTAVVGARQDDNHGSVYVFGRNNGGAGQWGQVTKLTAGAGATGGQRFGNSVAIDGDTAIVGAPNARPGGAFSGAAYLFERNLGGPENWGEVTSVFPSNPEVSMDNDHGTSVAIQGDMALVAAPTYDEAFYVEGAVYVYERNTGGTNHWGEVVRVNASDAEHYHQFGGGRNGVSLDGNTTVVGAWRVNDNASFDIGAAYVYDILCDVDGDLDGTANRSDNCPTTANSDQVDGDGDGVGDVCDSCPLVANADQADSDGDDIGDLCDPVFDNAPPVAGDIAVQATDIVPVSNTVNTSLTFTDANPVDAHTLTWSWGDGNTSAGTVNETTQTAAGSHAYTAVGVYTVSATLHDSHGGVDDATYEFVVVYDPNGKSVRGNGEIVSPPGACTLSPTCNASTTGSASVGFSSKYRNGKTTPDGRTRFVFRAGDLTFVADLQDWLVVSGHKAQFKGTGEINGAGNYGFMVTAVDADLTPVVGDLDRFRIKIWDKASSTVVYDNNRGAADDAEPTTNLARGNVEIVR